MAGRVSPLKKTEARLDAYISAITGIGGVRDKRNSYRFKAEPALDFHLAEDLFNGNDMAARICSLYPEEALAEGLVIKVSEGEAAPGAKSKGPTVRKDAADGDVSPSAEKETTFVKRVKELDAVRKVVDGGVWGRVHGDAVIWVSVEDGKDPSEPLELESVTAVKFLRLIDRTYLSVATYYDDPIAENYRRPATYNLAGAGTTLIVHESRLAKFRGSRTSESEMRRNGGYHFSILHRIQIILRDFGISWDSAALLLQNCTQGVFRLKDLMKVIASPDGAKLLEKRVEVIDMMRSVMKSVALDLEEEFTYQTATFTGVPDLLDRFATRLAASEGIPVTVLMGESPAGLNATGAADLQIWYKRVSAYARTELRPGTELILSCIAAELKIAPDDWSFEFAPPGKPTETEQATLRLAVAQTDKLYVDMEALSPEEVAVNRFGAEGWSMETTVDLELKQAIIAEEAKQDPADIVEKRLAPPVVAGKPGAPPAPGAKPAPKPAAK